MASVFSKAPAWAIGEPIGPNGHHVIFDKYERTLPRSDARFDYNFMGACIAHEFELDLMDSTSIFDEATAKGLKASGRSVATDEDDPTYPYKNSEDYFEWIDLLTAIDRSSTQFTMVEIGAGYGRWIANAAAALRRHRTKRTQRQKLIGVEADRARFDMMMQNCKNNQIADGDLRLIRAACAADGDAAFMRVNKEAYGNNAWYDPKLAAQFESERSDRIQVDDSGEKYLVDRMPTARLQSFLSEPVDFIDMDIQGSELDVIPACIDALDDAAKMIHVGTHSAAAESRLSQIFHLHGWRPRRIFSCAAVNRTPYGEFRFIDGIQSWENPRFD
jgi:FkbM family methyltransferase